MCSYTGGKIGAATEKEERETKEQAGSRAERRTAKTTHPACLRFSYVVALCTVGEFL